MHSSQVPAHARSAPWTWSNLPSTDPQYMTRMRVQAAARKATGMKSSQRQIQRLARRSKFPSCTSTLPPRPDLLPVLSRSADHGFQSVDICRATQDLIAHDEGRRAVDAKRLSQRKVPVDRSLERGIGHIRNEAIHIQADRGRDLLDLSCVDRTANLIERSMERNVLALLVRGQRRLGGERGIRSKDRKFLVGNAQLRIVFLRFDHNRRDLPAVRAIVVEELDESDIALRIPAGRGCCVAKYLIGAAFDDRLHLRLFVRALTRFELSDRLHDDLGMGHQVVVHATFKIVPRREIRDLVLPSKCRIENK